MKDPKVVTGVYWPRFSNCTECKKRFAAHPRLKNRQKTCGSNACVLSHRARYRRTYRLKNPEAELHYSEKVKSNRCDDYWRNYRAQHHTATERNRLGSELRKRLRRQGLQRQFDIVEVVDPPGYFDLFHGFAMSHRSLLAEYSATTLC